ncbi:hypothetical protein SNE40_012565 [Patella caerulea]|uniref:Fibrinogen C-terminal domain-containing protein n=1 Tax=Patella caerulea TaxID=87958 RepID=A0AAN8PW59_PATCE
MFLPNIVVILANILPYISGSPILGHFKTTSVCGDSQVKDGYQFARHTTRSLLTCASTCNELEKCYSFAYQDHDCFLYSMIVISDCSTSTPKTKKHFYEKSGCLNGGKADTTGTCYCKNGFMDERCYRRMKDCTDGMLEPSYAGKGLALYVQPNPDVEPFKVYCIMNYGGRTHVLYHLSESTNLTRNWEAYRNGFGVLTGDHWLGLEYVYHLVNSRNFKLEFETRNSLNNQFKQTYSNFKIANETDGYRITSVGTFSGPMADCMTDLLEIPFSTYDHGDANGLECAAAYGGGWWFRDYCARCNMVGRLVTTPDGNRLNISSEKYWPDVLWNPRRLKVWLQ